MASMASSLSKMEKQDAADAAFEDSRQAVQQIESDESRAYAWANLARKLEAAGKKGDAQQSLGKAEELARKISDTSVRAPLLEEIRVVRARL